MDGYIVVTIDGEKVGKVVGESGEYLIVERGLIRKSRRALPRRFAHVDDGEQRVRITIGKEVFLDSPELDGELDEQLAADHYGLAPSPGPGPEGWGDTDRGHPSRSSRFRG